jgi:TatD DNase family protein
MIDTHSHIYSEEFDVDSAEVILRAKVAGVTRIVLPNVDSDSLPRMLLLEATYADYCYAAIGVHPTSIKENYEDELNMVRSELERRKYIAIGEIGMDLYWDKTFVDEQRLAFQTQLQWALDYQLPVIIHVRDSFAETMYALAPFKGKGLRGVFHSFTGTLEDAKAIIAFGGFKLGINGIVTFKNSGLPQVLASIDIHHLLLETDSPYLTPTPYRGKRNESAYTALVAAKLAAIYSISLEEVDRITTESATEVFFS